MTNNLSSTTDLIRKQRQFVGPAQMSSILGFDKYLSSNQLRDQIENGYVVNSNYATSFGCDHESIALYYYQKIFNVEIEKPPFRVDASNRRIGGICDGLIGTDTGIEIKCHVGSQPLQFLPNKYLVQMTAYMYLYGRTKWILFSCCFDANHALTNYNIFEVTWNQVKTRWIRDWKPQIVQFCQEVTWQPKIQSAKSI